MTRSRRIVSTGAATIATIADEVGVSLTTVSKVLNGRSDVAPETRARVEASLERHRYRRRAKRQPSAVEQIDLVFHELDSGWATQIIHGVQAVTNTANVGVVLSQLGGRHRPSAQWLEGVLLRRPLGVLLVLCHLTEPQRQQLARRSIPLVVIDTDSATSASVPTVGSNNWNGGLLATRHLLELGHRRVACVSGPEDVLCSRARAAGFRSAHDEAGIPVDPDLVRYGMFSAQAGYQYGMELLTRPDRPTAIFAGSDMQALGVLRAARQLNLDVPADLSVIGYDDLPVASWIGPALTTVNQPLRDMAGTATQMLLDLARGAELSTSRIDLVTELVVRESTAPPRQRG
ncbi:MULTISPECIES: LacI family DNA-binding transcriptional regulator [unclassified Plantactinospora]|uniref:LacI family DNA-binding transcriptional regulator n=1 Tax=unclassified Plantactinospora TaxID=2631981 RepID=UPI000D15AE07|nr:MULTISPECIES: LacI family DNA-binding transcriptional regulator [unclassified Plantactinospora]AVT28255.1 LacI family transcriptional regulator [Plantactinospora sp. BC1]AVT38510.1 LacI family transcriptional regulator [Plantactinospora sp. BB1]